MDTISQSHSAPLTREDADLALVRGIAAGDSGDSLTLFYERFSGMAMALVVRIVRDRQHAEEILQEVFVELWRRAPSYDPRRSSVVSWVCLVARSRAIDRVRARERRHYGKHVSDEDVALADAGDRRPDKMTLAHQRAWAVRTALAKLTPEQRCVLELAYFRGLSQREIAEETGLPLGTVKSRMLSGMAVLRGELDFLRGEDL